MLFPGVGG